MNISKQMHLRYNVYAIFGKEITSFGALSPF